MILGTHVYPASGAAAERMQRALDSWTALPGVRLINLQFAGDPSPAGHAAFETRPVLRDDSRSVTRASGPRKPIVRELLDHLVDAAVRSGSEFAGFSNADILISPAAIERVASGNHDAVVFSRMDIDAVTGAPLGEFFSGQDTLFIRPSAYRAVRPRLRPYVVGEMPWDVIYTSILLTHARTALVNRGGECRHVFTRRSGRTRRSRDTPGGSLTRTGRTSRAGIATTTRRRRSVSAVRRPPRRTPCAIGSSWA